MEKLKKVVIKEELVALTGDFKKAIILNQFIYWGERVRDFDKFIKEEKERYANEGMNIDMAPTRGWIYKASEELAEETMIGLSKSNMRVHIKYLVEMGWLDQRNNPDLKWDRTLQYRVNLIKVQQDLQALGYGLEGYPLIINPPCSKTELTEGYNLNSPCSKTELYSPKTEHDKFYFETAIPETTQEITTEITNTTEKASEDAVVTPLQEEIILEETNIKELTTHQKKKVATWDIETLVRAIAIYKREGGLYFKLLEKIYKDGAIDSLTRKNSSRDVNKGIISHDWNINEFERLEQEYIERKLHGDALN